MVGHVQLQPQSGKYPRSSPVEVEDDAGEEGGRFVWGTVSFSLSEVALSCLGTSSSAGAVASARMGIRRHPISLETRCEECRRVIRVADHLPPGGRRCW